MDDIEMREAQIVLVSLQQQWDDERNRSFELMGQLKFHSSGNVTD